MPKAIPLKDGLIGCNPTEATHLQICLPGPSSYRILPVIISGSRKGTPCWTWNGSVDNPTLKPSLLTKCSDADGNDVVCHSYVTDGKVRFLGDCTHEFAGQTLDMLDAEL